MTGVEEGTYVVGGEGVLIGVSVEEVEVEEVVLDGLEGLGEEEEEEVEEEVGLMEGMSVAVAVTVAATVGSSVTGACVGYCDGLLLITLFLAFP